MNFDNFLFRQLVCLFFFVSTKGHGAATCVKSEVTHLDQAAWFTFDSYVAPWHPSRIDSQVYVFPSAYVWDALGIVLVRNDAITTPRMPVWVMWTSGCGRFLKPLMTLLSECPAHWSLHPEH